MNEKLNRQITAAGVLLFVPAVLFGGAFSGYLISEYFALKPLLKLLVMGIFFGATVFEVIRLIKFAIRITK